VEPGQQDTLEARSVSARATFRGREREEFDGLVGMMCYALSRRTRKLGCSMRCTSNIAQSAWAWQHLVAEEYNLLRGFGREAGGARHVMTRKRVAF
jgi:hypothetical protein